MHYLKMTMNSRIMALLSLQLKITIQLILENRQFTTQAQIQLTLILLMLQKQQDLMLMQTKKNATEQNHFNRNVQYMNLLMVNMVLLLLFRMYSCWELHITKISAILLNIIAFIFLCSFLQYRQHAKCSHFINLTYKEDTAIYVECLLTIKQTHLNLMNFQKK